MGPGGSIAVLVIVVLLLVVVPAALYGVAYAIQRRVRSGHAPTPNAAPTVGGKAVPDRA